ncbi:hypothetical protein Y032_0173g397 [Ancylostoma ceylanicum]|nr:hypothetical protein Y032_0173g397 [Ancylostoma ceylanicum]
MHITMKSSVLGSVTVNAMWSLLLTLGAVFLQLHINVEATAAFHCRNSLISDEWREMVLHYVNDKRKRLASGGQVDSTGTALKYAKDMNRLNWDCNLEHIAFQEIAKDCANSQQAQYGKTQAEFKSNAKCEINAATKQILKNWWDEVKKVDMQGDTNYVALSENFAEMANAVTKAFACTYNTCGSKGTLLCLYDQKAATNPAGALYQGDADKANICQACADCVDSLCPQTTTPVEITPSCTDDKMTEDGNKAAQWLHSYYRRLLATGWAKDGKSAYAKPAKKMLELTYDCTAAGGGAQSAAAQTYAAIENCPTADPAPIAGYSMNFKRLKNFTISDTGALEEAITDWWGPLEKIGLGSNLEFSDGSPLTSFANIAFDQTTKFACSVKNCPKIGETLVMCHYNPPITDGEYIYEAGKVCSGCGKLNKKCSSPPGLCI